MIREFLYQAYLVAFAGSVILMAWGGWESGEFFKGVVMVLSASAFWLIVGWVCQPLFKKK